MDDGVIEVGNFPMDIELMQSETVWQAMTMPLGELARMVVQQSYTPGVHDTALLDRCERYDKSSCKGQSDECVLLGSSPDYVHGSGDFEKSA